jgi:ATP-dependent 26S proteasome regulatory subunit
MRPGRLDRILYVSPPDQAARLEILRVNFKRMAVNEDVDAGKLAEIVCDLPSYVFFRWLTASPHRRKDALVLR